MAVEQGVGFPSPSLWFPVGAGESEDSEMKVELQEAQGCGTPTSGPREAAGGLSDAQVGAAKTPLSCRDMQPVEEEPEEGTSSLRWEAQWQEFLKVLQAPRSGKRKTWLPETASWSDPKASLPPLEGSVVVCQGSPDGCGSGSPPSFNGSAQEAESMFDVGAGRGAKGQIPEVKAEEAVSPEALRRDFRRLCYRDAWGPREVYCRLRELCVQWLKPERHTKEQILDLVILEQFLAVLSSDMRSWVKGEGSRSCSQAVALAEGFLLRDSGGLRSEPQGPVMDQEVTVTLTGKGMSQETPPRQPSMETKQEEVGNALGDEEQGGRDGQPFLLSPRETTREMLERNLDHPERSGIFQRHQRENADVSCQGDGICETPARLGIRKWRKRSKSPGADKLSQDESNFNRDPGAEKQHKCSVCGKIFRRHSDLSSHQRTHRGEKPYTCLSCGKRFNRSTNLTSHQRIHTGEKPYRCADCGKSFCHKSGLIRHRRTHTGEKPYACPTCGKCFGQRQHLITHQRNHTGEKPFACTECGKRFSQSQHLIIHRRNHTGEKPFECAQCRKSFCDKSTLIRHQRSHLGKKPFRDPQCEESFGQSKLLLRHQRIHIQPPGIEATAGHTPIAVPWAEHCQHFYNKIK